MDALMLLRYGVYIGVAAFLTGLVGLAATGALAWRQLLKLKQLADEVHGQHQIVTPIGPGSDLVTTSDDHLREHQHTVVAPRVAVLSRRIGLVPLLLMWSLRLCAIGAVTATFGLIGHFLLSP